MQALPDAYYHYKMLVCIWPRIYGIMHYSKLWPVEIYFRQTKGNLGINQYQVRHITAIKRFWALTVLTYLFCVLGKPKVSSFAKGLIAKSVPYGLSKAAYTYVENGAVNFRFPKNAGDSNCAYNSFS